MTLFYCRREWDGDWTAIRHIDKLTLEIDSEYVPHVTVESPAGCQRLSLEQYKIALKDEEEK